MLGDSLAMVERYLSQSLPVLLTRSLHDIFNKAHQTLELHKKSQITRVARKVLCCSTCTTFGSIRTQARYFGGRS
jgi:hypothetical protein